MYKLVVVLIGSSCEIGRIAFIVVLKEGGDSYFGYIAFGQGLLTPLYIT